MIYYTDNEFDLVKLNPFYNNNPYTDNWILLKLIDDNSFRQYTGGGTDGVFQLILTKKISTGSTECWTSSNMRTKQVKT
jgi:adenine-specific DNA methylase